MEDKRDEIEQVENKVSMYGRTRIGERSENESCKT